MTEFLKSNPTALRHCILYEFLHEKPANKSFDHFVKTVGYKAISEEEFEYRFDQFERGEFDDNKMPHLYTHIQDALLSDQQALRACVLYEFLKSRHRKLGHDEIYAKYNKFCKVIGEDALTFPEFEFWYYRFLNGEFDLNHVPKKTYELDDLPIDVIEIIVQKLDLVDKLSLGRASKPLDALTDNIKFDENGMHFYLDNSKASLGFSSGLAVVYEPFKNDSNVEYKDWQEALRDFKKVLKNPKFELSVFSVSFFANLKENKKFEALEEALKSTKNGQICVNTLQLETDSLEPLVRILPYLKPGVLEKIVLRNYTIKGDTEKLEKIMEMDQWKQAKVFESNGPPFVGSPRHLFHFDRFKVVLERLTVDEFREIEESLLTRPQFLSCDITLCSKLPREIIGIAEQFPLRLRRPIPNSNGFFDIKLFKSSVEIIRTSR